MVYEDFFIFFYPDPSINIYIYCFYVNEFKGSVGGKNRVARKIWNNFFVIDDTRESTPSQASKNSRTIYNEKKGFFFSTIMFQSFMSLLLIRFFFFFFNELSFARAENTSFFKLHSQVCINIYEQECPSPRRSI